MKERKICENYLLIYISQIFFYITMIAYCNLVPTFQCSY
jgi:hypothetical protein